jgi:hypothetical protein
VEERRCKNGQVSLPFYQKISNLEKKEDKTNNVEFDPLTSIICPDGWSFCPSSYSCCKMNDGSYGCCPLQNVFQVLNF